MSLDHIAFYVPIETLDPLTDFLLEALGHLSFQKHSTPFTWLVALGPPERAYFWLSGAKCEDKGWRKDEVMAGLKRMHYGFVADSQEKVREFHDRAIKAGGKDNGEPGLRPMFGDPYYAAFVHDPVVGINWEVVCRTK